MKTYTEEQLQESYNRGLMDGRLNNIDYSITDGFKPIELPKPMKGLLKVTNNGFRVCTTLYNDIWSNDVAVHPESKIKVNGDFKFSEVEFNLIDIDGQFFAELINLTKTNN
jgi:hypothetical protein